MPHIMPVESIIPFIIGQSPFRSFGARYVVEGRYKSGNSERLRQKATRKKHSYTHPPRSLISESSLLDGGWSLHLGHEVVVPFSVDANVSDCTKLNCLDQIVVQIRIQTWLFERVDGRPSGTAPDEPRL